MKSLITVLLIILCFSLSAQDDTAIIKESFIIQLNDKSIDIELDKESTVELNKSKVELLLSKNGISKFIHGDIKFDFPSYMHYEFDPGSEGVKIRTITGESILLMLQEHGIVEDLENILLNAIKQEWAAMKAGLEITEETLDVKDIKLKGTGLFISLGNIVLYQGIYIINSNTNLYALILQDTLDSKKNHTEEFGVMLEMLFKSFVF